MRCTPLKTNIESENEGFQQVSNFRLKSWVYKEKTTQMWYFQQLQQGRPDLLGKCSRQETETMASKLQALGAALSACAGLEDFRERVKDSAGRESWPDPGLSNCVVEKGTQVWIVFMGGVESSSKNVWWFWGIYLIMIRIVWIGQKNDPKLQKDQNSFCPYKNNPFKELKDELQKKADASKFGCLFSNITTMVFLV